MMKNRISTGIILALLLGFFVSSCIKETVTVTGIELDRQKISLKVGDTAVLKAVLLPSNAHNQAISWTSSDTGVAVVLQGKVSAKKVGTATIIASTECGGHIATCDLEVRENAKGISLDESLELYEFQEGVLTARIITDEGEPSQSPSVVWECREDSLLTVFAGRVLAKRAPLDGHPVVVSASTRDGLYRAECRVSVKCHVTGIELERSSYELEPGGQEKIAYTVLPARATDKRVYFSSGNEEIVKVGGDGTISAVKGSAEPVKVTVTAYDESPAHIAECIVKVEKSVSELYITADGLNPVESVDLLKGSSNTILIARCVPDDATDFSVKWASGDDNVVSVEEISASICKLTARGCGSVNVYATSPDGKKAQCRVNVYTPIEDVVLNVPKTELYENEQEELTFTVYPPDAEVKAAEWKSLNERKAAVRHAADDGGIVTAILAESETPAGISLTLYDAAGNKFIRECGISVKCLPSSIKVSPRTLVLSLENGKAEADITASVYPPRTSDPSFTWSSSDEALVRIDDKGHVTARDITPYMKPVMLKAVANERNASGELLSDECEVVVLNSVKGISITRDGVGISVLSINKGETVNLKAKLVPENVSFGEVNWTSLNEGVATIDSEGRLTGKGGGQTSIIATTSDGKTAVCTVSVVVPITSVSISEVEKGSTVEMNETQVKEFAVTLSPADATETLVWKSGNDKSVSVLAGNAAGGGLTCKIVAIKATDSSIIVSAETNGGNRLFNFYVRVKCPVTNVQVVEKNVVLEKGKSATLTAKSYPDRASQKIEWTSDNSNIVSVTNSSTGEIKAVAEGEVKVWAKSVENGTVRDYTTVKVLSSVVPVESVTITSAPYQINVGETVTLNATVLPQNATSKSLTWTSSAPGVARVVNSSFGMVEGISAGTATITATATDGSGKSASVILTVVGSQPQPDTHVTGVSISPSGSVTLTVGSSKKFTATVVPSNASDKYVSWSVGDRNVATVDSGGNVQAVGAGTTVVTVKTRDGGYTASCTVNVEKKPELESIRLEPQTVSLYTGQKYSQLKAVYTPAGIIPEMSIWRSSNSSVAKVDNYGIIEALSPGSTKITLVADGITSNPCVVNVSNKPTYSISNVGSDGLKINVGEAYQLEVTFNPPEASYLKLAWDFKNTGTPVLQVEDGKVLGLKKGSATVYVWIDGVEEPRKGKACRVEVNAVLPESMSLDRSALTVKVGESIELSPVFRPVNTTDKSATWSSSDNSVVTVSNGVVTAKAEGTAVITATANARTKSAQQLKAVCYVTVTDGSQNDNTGENVGFDDLN